MSISKLAFYAASSAIGTVTNEVLAHAGTKPTSEPAVLAGAVAGSVLSLIVMRPIFKAMRGDYSHKQAHIGG